MSIEAYRCITCNKVLDPQQVSPGVWHPTKAGGYWDPMPIHSLMHMKNLDDRWPTITRHAVSPCRVDGSYYSSLAELNLPK